MKQKKSKWFRMTGEQITNYIFTRRGKMITTNRETKTYAITHQEGFYVDIQESKECIEAWIYHEKYGIKMLMFGIPGRMNRIPDLQTMEQLADKNIEQYLEMYRDEHMH